MPCWLEASHHALSQSGWLVRSLGAVILSLILAVLDTRHDLLLGRMVAPELICDDHARHILQTLQKLTKEHLGGFLIRLVLRQYIQHSTILIHRSPQIMDSPIDLEEQFVQMPPVAR